MQSTMTKEDKSTCSDISPDLFLDLDVFKKHHEVWRSQYGDTCLHLAAIRGNIAIVKYLLEDCEYDPNVLNEEGKTILHIAAVQKNFALVRYLVTDKHRDPHIHRDIYGWSPFHYACASGDLDIIQFFISEMDHSLNFLLDSFLIHYRNNAFSAFHVAIASGNSAIVQYFTAHTSQLMLHTR